MRLLALRIGSAAVVVLGVTTLVFLFIHMVPGDPVLVMLGEYASASDQATLRASLGLDRPLLEQWYGFMSGLVRLDLGTSLLTGQPVLATLRAHFAMTLVLALAGLAVAVALGLPLGTLAALRRGGIADALCSALATLGMSVPNFVLGPLLILVFAVMLRWLPVSGSGEPAAVILPALTLGLSLAAVLARMSRAALLDVLQEPYIRAARARGLSPMRVVMRHALCNAALPILTVIGMQAGALLGGAVITETIFNWPGIGQLAIESIQRRDYPLLQGCVLLIALSYVIINTLTDVLYAVADPRVDFGS